MERTHRPAFRIGLGLVLGLCLLGAAASCSEEARPGGGGGGGGIGACESNENSEGCRLEQLALCGERSLSECEELEFCDVLTARRIDESRSCVEPEGEEVGCGIIGCGGLYTHAKAPNGDEWLFATTCLPAGWTELDPITPEACAGAGGAGGGGGANP